VCCTITVRAFAQAEACGSGGIGCTHAHEQADHVVPLLDEQASGHTRIHSAAHRDDHFFTISCHGRIVVVMARTSKNTPILETFFYVPNDSRG
jgi:hypothetical protein